jgi:hypothetical protein
MDNPAGPHFNFKAPEHGWAFGYYFTPVSNQWIWVAADGTRFINEAYSFKHGKIPFHGIYINAPTPLPVHVIFDETLRKKGPLYASTIGGWAGIIEKYKWSADNSEELTKGWIVQADTLRDLAVKIGKNPDAIENTVNTWNGYATAGKDPEYGRAASKLAPIQTPPYYAMELVPCFVNTQGGPRRNKHARILDVTGNPIPRLYSAGECGSIHSYLYQGAGNIGECMAFGRIAGRNAAAEAPRS